jgi:hypothetical protein
MSEASSTFVPRPGPTAPDHLDAGQLDTVPLPTVPRHLEPTGELPPAADPAADLTAPAGPAAAGPTMLAAADMAAMLAQLRETIGNLDAVLAAVHDPTE